ncbi:MAG: class I SAM-dependent methyltransferase [Spirochaetes bacterium]|nr:class I SAM-dependent methyltransferase [Spirochaetota bacterium]
MKKEKVYKAWSTPVSAEDSRAIPCALCAGGRFKPALQCEGFSYVKCADCGLVQVNPQPEKTDVMRRYGEAFGEDYFSYELAHEEPFLQLQLLAFQDADFDTLEKESFGRAAGEHGDAPAVLDVGCATGALLALLKGRGWRTTGVEISPSAQYAQKERGLDIKTIPLEENGFPAASFELVHASHLIEHLNAPRIFLDEVFRVLKPDGRFLITTPNIDGFQSRFFGNRWRSAIFDHLYLFSVRTLKAMLAGSGFVVEGVYTWGGLGAGLAPLWLKRPADRLAKRFGAGDVMMMKARKKKPGE